MTNAAINSNENARAIGSNAVCQNGISHPSFVKALIQASRQRVGLIAHATGTGVSRQVLDRMLAELTQDLTSQLLTLYASPYRGPLNKVEREVSISIIEKIRNVLRNPKARQNEPWRMIERAAIVIQEAQEDATNRRLI